MNRWSHLSLSLLLGIAGLLALGTPVAGEDKKDQGAPDVVKPSKEMEVLRQRVGTWDALMKMGGDMEAKGVEVNRLACNGLWLISDFKCTMFGQSFEGHGISGYDPAKKKYTGVWVDSMQTYVMPTEGTYDAATKTLTYTAEGPDMSGKVQKLKMITKFESADRHVFTMATPGANGKDQVMFTITYTRKK